MLLLHNSSLYKKIFFGFCQLGENLMTLKLNRRAVVAVAAAFSFANPVFAGGHQVVDSIHFVIPGGEIGRAHV